MENIETKHNQTSKSNEPLFDALYFKIYDAVTWKYLLPYVPKEPDAFVLDAGGGTPRWAIRLAEKGCKVILMDSSEEMLNAAAEKIRAQGYLQKITLKKGSVAKLGYPDGTFDMILFDHALFLLKKPDAAIRELRRVLKKNAPLIISAQNRYVQALSSLAGKPRTDNVERAFKVLINKKHECMTKDGEIQIYTWTPQEFRQILERNGLRVKKIIGKMVTMPLRVRQEFFIEKNHSEELFNKILKFELAFCEKQDALALAGHLQAIAFKP